MTTHSVSHSASSSRREFLHSASYLAGLPLFVEAAFGATREPIPVVGVTSVYHKNSHADVIFGKILEGYNQKGGHGPNLKLVGLYVDQFPERDMSRGLAEKHGFRVYPTIEAAITQGQNRITAKGVLSIGEHGSYPRVAETGQTKYPRRRFFDEIVETLTKYDTVVPIFNDKHLSYNWKDAKHMYDTAKQRKLPFMAGSSLPVAWRVPEFQLPINCEIEDAIGIGYGGPESYGFHALEAMQCMLERRKGGETGVKSVVALRGDAIWQAERDGVWSRRLLESGLAQQPKRKKGKLEDLLGKGSPFYVIEYLDGLRATCAMLNGVVGEFGFAAKLKGQPPKGTWISLQPEPPFGHFSWLVEAIEAMIRTGRPSYPVERTLLTTGILDRAMHSLAEDGKKFATPELHIRYKPTGWHYATTKPFEPPAK